MRDEVKNSVKDIAIFATGLATGIGAEYVVSEWLNILQPSKFKGLYWLGAFGITWMVGTKVSEFTQNFLKELTE